MRAASLLVALVFAVSVSSRHIQVDRRKDTLSLTRRLNITSGYDIVQHDQARARNLKAIGAAKKSGLQGRQSTDSLATNTGVAYTASVGVGSPPTQYDLLIDTGSSNTWIGAGKAYTPTSTSTKTANKVSVAYGSGEFSGTEYTDQVTISPDLIIQKQSIGVASSSSGFSNVDGILGIGPVDLTIGTLNPDTNSAIPTVTDNLFSNGAIKTDSIGIFFRPLLNKLDNGEGILSWGGIDKRQLKSDVHFTPITVTQPASFFWGIDQSIRYGTSNTILSTTAGIVDTGTTLILLASDAFAKYQTATGATLDGTTGLLRVSNAQFGKLQSLFFDVGGVSYEIIPNAQIWPRFLNTQIGGTAGNIYLIVSNLGSSSGEGLDFINGFAFLERYYSVYDTANSQVGFASTEFTRLDVN